MLQSDRVAYRGQIIAVVVADSLEIARQAQALLRFDYEPEPHDVLLSQEHPGLYKPDKVNPAFDTDTERGEFDSAFGAAEVRIDATYRTPAMHNNPMEPHASVAVWGDERVTVYDSNQGAGSHGQAIAKCFGLDPERVHVISPHVGGGFGSKGQPRPPVIATVMAAQVARRPVKLAVTRQQMFSLTGYRTPTIQRLRLGAGSDGRLVAIAHEVCEQTSTLAGVRRADGGGDSEDVCVGQHTDRTPVGGARSTDAVLDAGSGGVPGDVRAGVRGRRAGVRLRNRPGGAAHAQRARGRP